MSTEEVSEEIPAQPVAKYVEQLRSPNREQREQAVAELRKIGPDNILDILLEPESVRR